MRKLIYIFLFWQMAVSPILLHGQTLRPSDLATLKTDLEKVWPLVQTVKIEFDLAIAQMEFLQSKEEKKAFMEKYESFVKDKYFKKIIDLNIRQGKLLLLLIHRELGKTPFELLKEYRSLRRANFWEQFAHLVGASLKEEYSPSKYPAIEIEISKSCLKQGI